MWEALRPDHLIVTLDGTVIGDVMLRHGDGWAQAGSEPAAARSEAELGYVFDPAHSGQGYATEASAAVLDLAFGPLGLRRVTALCFADNTSSWRLLERLGMRREAHHIADSLHAQLGWLDGYVYAILAPEWQARRVGYT